MSNLHTTLDFRMKKEIERRKGKLGRTSKCFEVYLEEEWVGGGVDGWMDGQVSGWTDR